MEKVNLTKYSQERKRAEDATLEPAGETPREGTINLDEGASRWPPKKRSRKSTEEEERPE